MVSRRRAETDESELWSAVSDLFGAISLIFLVLFLLAAALVGDPDTSNVKAEITKLKRQNIVLLDEVERLQKELDRRRSETKTHSNEGVIALSSIDWAIILSTKLADPDTVRYELQVIDPAGGQITPTKDRSDLLSNRGASWASAGAEQIIAHDRPRDRPRSASAGDYTVRLTWQKGNGRTDTVTIRLVTLTDEGRLKTVHQRQMTFSRAQPLEQTIDVFAFKVDNKGRVREAFDL
ncbi:MAG: hypothetical protein D6761_10565 [Candidatus Dadabacteria bacterium]|nr:MAG: hypothetical protein D6761_10565 [Candidatus Dadabacteria bacterium]